MAILLLKTTPSMAYEPRLGCIFSSTVRIAILGARFPPHGPAFGGFQLSKQPNAQLRPWAEPC